jgi:carbon starvation protein CstA
MTDADPNFALYELYLGTAGKVSDRRATANSWMLSVNSALVALYGYLQADSLSVNERQKAVWLLAIPAAGLIVCVAWRTLLESYRQLNRAKFEVLQKLEGLFEVQPFTREQEVYRIHRRKGLATIERSIPACFFLLYMVILIAAIFRR